MRLIIGLGNPEKKYEHTWHNIGFIVIDAIQKNKCDEFVKFKNSKKYKAEICEGVSPEEKIILAKPQTYMNNSGQAVKALIDFYKIKPNNIWVIHDDIDLPVGKIRISQNASAGGHKGVQSIIDTIGTQEFVRFRLGIQKEPPVKMPAENYVLQKIDENSKVAIDEMIQKTLSAIEIANLQGISEAMNEFN